MKKIIFIITIAITQATDCIIKKQKCQDLITEFQCKNTHVPYISCSWNNYSNVCEGYTYATGCNLFFDQQSCSNYYDIFQEFECYWQDDKCNKRQKIQPQDDCESFTQYSDCVNNFRHSNACAWIHNKCKSINQCDQITDFYQCRNNGGFKDRCQYVVNNIPSSQEKELSYTGSMFENIECRNRDCVYQIKGYCPDFINGRKCFLNKENCTQCSYMTNPKDCLSNKMCTWQNSICQNVLCKDITSSKVCEKYDYCEFNKLTVQCQTKPLDYCHSYNISSKPKKTEEI